MGRCIIIFLFLCNYFLAAGQNLAGLTKDYQVSINNTWQDFTYIQTSDSPEILKNALEYSIANCDCSLFILFNKKYKDYYPFPPHADMMRILTGIAGEKHYTLSVLEDSTIKNGKYIWMGEAHFAPSSYFPEYDYGWLRTYYQDNLPLLHYFLLYNGDKETLSDYVIQYRPDKN